MYHYETKKWLKNGWTLLIRYYLNLDQQRPKPAKKRQLREAVSMSLSALLQADLQGNIKQV